MSKGYDEHILKILSEVGESGISIQNLVTNVYNMSRTLFSSPIYDDVDRCVRRYIRHNSGTVQSLIERMDRRGFYRLNTSRSAYACQLMLQFGEVDSDIEDDKPAIKHDEDLSLSLF